jgi:hypothetical protein
MPAAVPLAFAVAGLVGLGVLVVFGRRVGGAWLTYRGKRVVVCPENREMSAIDLDARHAAFTAAQGRPQLRLDGCTRWPEREACGQECLGQVESAPEACRLRSILDEWYRGKECVLCGRDFHAIQWHDHKPGLLSSGGELLDWTGFRPEQVIDVLGRHKPVCWDCRIAEGFRRAHPDLVTDRSPRLGPPPSMA